MPISLVELARKAAAAARADGRAAAPVPPAARYRGVTRRGTRYAAILWNPFLKRSVWLGSYATAVEAAYAYDAAARSVLRRRARPNFPELRRRAAAATATAREVAAVDLAVSRRGQKPLRQQQPVRRPYRALLIRCWAPASSDDDAAAPAQHPEPPHVRARAVEPDQSVVGDNFTD
jgi:hypothetical protein